MAYATQDDLVPLRITAEELVELTCDDDAGQVNVDVVNKVLEEASGRVEGYCRQRYATPLQTSDTVKAVTLDIAVYLLFSRRRNARITETIRTNYEDAIGLLKDISTGKASLDQPLLAAGQVGSNNPVVTRRPERFSDRNLDGYSGSDLDKPGSVPPIFWTP